MISENPKLTAGLSPQGIAWAFTANLTRHDVTAEYWQPLTLLTRLADVQFFGLNAGRHHLTNVLLHIVAGLVLFGALSALLRSTFRSALITALFLIHPLHVEPVAWLAARKDIREWSFLFRDALGICLVCGASQLAPLSHRLRQLCVRQYGQADGRLVAALCCSCSISGRSVVFNALLETDGVFRLFVEKLPLFLIALVVAALAVMAQQQHGAIGDVSLFPLSVRLGNAAISFCIYLGQTFVPVGLGIYYPHPGDGSRLGAWRCSSAACCVLITAVCLLQAQRRPWLIRRLGLVYRGASCRFLGWSKSEKWREPIVTPTSRSSAFFSSWCNRVRSS